MPFSKLLNDCVNLIKKDGRRFDHLPASVQSSKILTMNPNIPIEEGDRFERGLPSGITETYLVIDAGFTQGVARIPSHYNSSVRKETAIRDPVPGPQVIYNLIGEHAKVNIQSVDASTNVVNVEASSLFEAMQKTILESIPDEELRHLLAQKVDDMQNAAGSHSFVDYYKEFIGLTADHISVFTAFLPALTQLLGGA